MKIQEKSSYSRREFIGLTGASAAVSIAGFPFIARAAQETENVIVLGIDGMDPSLLTRFVADGTMPNAKRLMAMGGFSPLRSSNPAQSPVAWSNFISGTNPGGHGIFDFIARDADTLTPYFSSSRIQGEPTSLNLGKWRLPLSAPKVVNLRRGPTFWKNLSENGVDCTVLRMPANFPPTDSQAKTLSGLGTPDIHGSYGIFTFFTDDRRERSRYVPGGRIARVHVEDHMTECVLHGPLNNLSSDKSRIDVTCRVFIDTENRAARLTVQEEDFILAEGEWSDWVRISFTMLPHLAKTYGICRFFLKSIHNGFRLYVSPINMDPGNPSLPISTPSDYSRLLAANIGDFYTQGLPEDTSALSAGVLSDNEYREQATYVLDENLRMFEHEFSGFQRGFFFSYFSSLDLNCHTFWRTLDPGHPLYSADIAKQHGDFIPWLYARIDMAIGQAMERIKGNSVLVVMSDHGFGSFRRQFNLNSWLMDNGYAARAPGMPRGKTAYFQELAWTATKAYALGINSLYLNIKGREPHGTVATGRQEEDLIKELIARLKAVRDPDNGQAVISNVYRPSRIYSGPYTKDAPDLIIGYNKNYRASWDTILGKYPEQHLLDNTDPWSGDHTMDSHFVPGVLLSNRQIKSNSPALTDLAPTFLSLYGMPIPTAMTGKPIM